VKSSGIAPTSAIKRRCVAMIALYPPLANAGPVIHRYAILVAIGIRMAINTAIFAGRVLPQLYPEREKIKNMLRVALVYKKDKYILREYRNGESTKIRDKSREYGEYAFLEDAIEELSRIYPEQEEFIFKMVGFIDKK